MTIMKHAVTTEEMFDPSLIRKDNGILSYNRCLLERIPKISKEVCRQLYLKLEVFPRCFHCKLSMAKSDTNNCFDIKVDVGGTIFTETICIEPKDVSLVEYIIDDWNDGCNTLTQALLNGIFRV